MQKCKQSATSVPRPLFGKKVAFPNLETLKLSSIHLKKIWDDNQVSTIAFIQSLTYLTIEHCGALKCLFSSSKVATFSKLKCLEISKCHMMEEIIVTEDGVNNNVITEVQFPKLEKIIIEDMQNLKTIWQPQLTASSFGELKTLDVKKCPKLVNIFPSYMQKKFCSLETLTVSDCDAMEEIFQLDANEMCSKKDTTEMKSMTLLRLPKLKQIWSGEPQGILSFDNLQSVHVEDCLDLEYLFPFSVAAKLLQLEELFLDGCKMNYIVGKKEGLEERTVIFVLNRLKSFDIWNSTKLKGFYAGNHTLACSSLKEVNVFNCSKLKLFKTISRGQRRSLDDTIYGQPLFSNEEVIYNLKELTLNNEDANVILQNQLSKRLFNNLKLLNVSEFENEEATFPYWILQNMPTLETIFVEASTFKEIFQDEQPMGGEGKIDSRTRLKSLTLADLPQLQHICKDGCKIDSILEVIEILDIIDCSSLKILLPSTTIFSHLRCLEVKSCHGLINLFTSSVVRSLVKLTVMKITGCNSIEEIVTEKEDNAKEEIIFGALKVLELVCLPKLNRFCSSNCLLRFQLLETLVVRQCPRMNTFSKGIMSAVQLRKVQMDESDNGCYWEGDLNRTIWKMFIEKVAFQSFQHLRLAEYPELKELWFGELQHKTFLCLKSLVVQRCDFLTDSLFPLNLVRVLQHLKELEVRDCDLLEAVFDMEVKDGKEMQEKEISQLKKLTLSSLTRLKHVWKKDPKETLSFQNLCEVCVDRCESLERLFPLSVVNELMKLEKLEVRSCGIDVIVAKEEGVEETIEFVFPGLSSIKFWHLKNLRSLYPGKHTSKWPSLKNVDIYDCKKLGIFAPALPIFQEAKEEDVLDVQCRQPLFFVEKVIPNLERLALNYKDAMIIWEGQYQEKLLHNIESLALRCFYEQSPTLIGNFLRRFANLEKLELSDSSYEMIFPWEGVSDQNTGMNIQIRQVRLDNLGQLKYIWSKDSSLLDSLSGNLESLEVLYCSSLKNLVPPSICFENLTNIYVGGCEGLIYLITSSTAKSLVQLKTMTIVNCRALEHVICTDEEEEVEAEISFESLESLELISLSRLENFSSGEHTLIFPSLDVLKISGCPKMDMFSPGVLMAPVLNAVTMEEGKKRWKDGLNSTIRQLFQEKVVFRSLQHLRLAEYPELKELWFGELPHKTFLCLKSLVVQRCDFLTDSLFPLNLVRVLQLLEELEVRDCDLLEAVFDMEVRDNKEMQEKEINIV
ncbi:hypothetical protein L6164_002292 [Bauhinia variegata]|uniref:Uncharacterized protein n=1 Tax=Bauhinia variegata TaxID=167791 RepID=A0ACB9PXR9_BAUVA|nr:hypothetical protein L6164_002292 [Bauhinia variegata]